MRFLVHSRQWESPPSIVNIVGDIYTQASTTIKTPEGTTGPIPVLAGVKQGCPLSSILFNLTIEPIIRAIQEASTTPECRVSIANTNISVLAYADDLVILAKTPEGLDKLLATASEQADHLLLNFKPVKCATLSLSCRNGTSVLPRTYYIQDQAVPALTEEQQQYRYLGVPIGLPRFTNLAGLIEKLRKDIETITASLLAPWQKIDAIKTFVQPSLNYVLRAADYLKSDLKKLCTAITKNVKKICQLPVRATNAYIFAANESGGLAFVDPNVDADVQVLTQAVRILSYRAMRQLDLWQ